MSHTLALESQPIAEELYALLKAMEPARWRRELEPALRERLNLLREQLHELLERTESLDGDAALATLRERLESIRAVIQEATPHTDLSARQLKQQWNDLRLRLLPAYEAMAVSLKVQAIHVPSLRPSNYARNVWHVGSGIGVLILLQHILSESTTVWVALVFTIMAWSMEISRRKSTRINNLLMRLFSPVAHPHERYRVNSATWYTTSLLLLAATMPAMAAALAVTVLAFSDPAAAIIGRRFGRHTLVAGRTLEGSMAFVVAGVLSSLGVLAIYYPSLSTTHMLLLALGGAIPGAVAEMVSERVDDNFSIPTTVGIGVSLTALALGLV